MNEPAPESEFAREYAMEPLPLEDGNKRVITKEALKKMYAMIDGNGDPTAYLPVSEIAPPVSKLVGPGESVPLSQKTWFLCGCPVGDHPASEVDTCPGSERFRRRMNEQDADEQGARSEDALIANTVIESKPYSMPLLQVIGMNSVKSIEEAEDARFVELVRQAAGKRIKLYEKVLVIVSPPDPRQYRGFRRLKR